MSRPKGSKNKKTLEREKQTLFNIEQKPPENAMIFVAETKDPEPDKVTIPVEEKPSKEPVKQLKINAVCDKCHANIYCSPITVNLSHLLGQASWHRDCKLEKISLCTSCARELNKLVDDWIMKGNPNYYKWNTDTVITAQEENSEKISENS